MSKALREYIDASYIAEKRKNPHIRFPVYGTVITGGLLRKYSHTCCIYCDKDSVYYNAVGNTNNISSNIEKLYIRRSIFSKKIIRLKIKNNKTHRITIFEYDSFSTDTVGSQPQHCQELIDVLEKLCAANKGKIKNKIKSL